jgi:hypothetical protein
MRYSLNNDDMSKLAQPLRTLEFVRGLEAWPSFQHAQAASWRYRMHCWWHIMSIEYCLLKSVPVKIVVLKVFSHNTKGRGNSDRFPLVLCFSRRISILQSVPLATEPGISLIILSLMRILQRNLKRT